MVRKTFRSLAILRVGEKEEETRKREGEKKGKKHRRNKKDYF